MACNASVPVHVSGARQRNRSETVTWIVYYGIAFVGTVTERIHKR